MTSFIHQVGEFSHLSQFGVLVQQLMRYAMESCIPTGICAGATTRFMVRSGPMRRHFLRGFVQKWGDEPSTQMAGWVRKIAIEHLGKKCWQTKVFFRGSPCSDKPMGAQQHGSFQALVQVMVRNARLEECMKRMLGRWLAWCWLESNTREIQSVLLPHGEHWSKSIAHAYIIFVLSWSNLGLQHDCYYTYAIICQVQTCRVEWAFPKCTNVRWFGSGLGDLFSSHRKGLRVHAARRHHWIRPPDHVWFSVQRSPSSWTFKVSNCTSSRRPWVTLTSSKRILPVLSLARVVLSLARIAQSHDLSHLLSPHGNLLKVSSWICKYYLHYSSLIFCVRQHGPSGFQFWKLFYVFAHCISKPIYIDRRKDLCGIDTQMDGFRCSLVGAGKHPAAVPRRDCGAAEESHRLRGLLFWSPSGHRVMGDDKGCFGTGARGILFLPPAFLDSSQAYHLRRWHIIL